LAYFALSVLYNIRLFILYKKIAAIIHHITGEVIQLQAIFAIVAQDTIPNHIAAIHQPITHQTIE